MWEGNSVAVLLSSLSDHIASELLPEFNALNADQQRIVTHEDGPIIVIAGPGSGKTQSLALRAMNLLLQDRASPQELVICTYTKKAAFELQDRLSEIATQVGYGKDLSLMRLGTIHSICERIMSENLHRLPALDQGFPPLGNNFRTLDDLAQSLFIFEHLEIICGKNIQFFMNYWRSRWRIVKGLKSYFDKITEELINVQIFADRQENFLRHLACAYKVYWRLLIQANSVDFALLLKMTRYLLMIPTLGRDIAKGIRYVLVDEYQDTNYVQEQILVRLASQTENIFVVGDEDQSLYRFRGATVQNILSFMDIYPQAIQDHLSINYRSHPKIIDLYNRWLQSIDWKSFRHYKNILPAKPRNEFANYPAVQIISGQDIYDEARQFAELVVFLKEQGKIMDYNQVALLLFSVKTYKSSPYVEALQNKGIPVYCPRSDTFFQQIEVQLMIGCFQFIFGYSGSLSNETVGNYDLYQYLNSCTKVLAEVCESQQEFEAKLQVYAAEIAELNGDLTKDRRLADYFYALLFSSPFLTYLEEPDRLQNMVIFSELLETFQDHYHFNEISEENKASLVDCFFNRFLCLVCEEGLNQFEDPEMPFPSGHLPIMTIHQAKGLEFPVVVVGSLERELPKGEEIDTFLGRYYPRKQFEPKERIPLFDYLRLYYVAFSRAENLLVLTSNLRHRPTPYFTSIIQDLPQWPDTKESLSQMSQVREKSRATAKKRYSFTGHISMYETCPRQYQYYKANKFIASHPPDTIFGLLVHQTVERIHRIVLDGQVDTITQEKLREVFELVYYFLSQVSSRKLSDEEKEKAFQQVEDYFYNNQIALYDLKNSEEQITIIEDKYLLTGRIDAVIERNGVREIWDLKTSRQLDPGSPGLERYERQLNMYAYALTKRDPGIPIKRLILYWTEEPLKENAMTIFPYNQEKVNRTVNQFDDVVSEIERKNFQVLITPEPAICKKCDIRYLCKQEGLIDLS
jgi:DNA helicase-2/ATP-dependent DNA helicase PcrA